MCSIKAMETLTFPHWAAFLNWKEEGASTHTFYVQPNGAVSSAMSTADSVKGNNNIEINCT